MEKVMDNIGRIFLNDISSRLSSHIVYQHELFEQISQKQLSHEQLSFFITQYTYTWQTVDMVYKDFFERLKVLKELDYKTLQLGNCLCDENLLINLLQNQYYVSSTLTDTETLNYVKTVREICLSSEEFSHVSSLTGMIIGYESFNLWLFTRTDFRYLFSRSKDVKLVKKILGQRILDLSQILGEIMKISSEPNRSRNSYFTAKILLESLELFLHSNWYKFNLNFHHKKVGVMNIPKERFDPSQIPFPSA